MGAMGAAKPRQYKVCFIFCQGFFKGPTPHSGIAKTPSPDVQSRHRNPEIKMTTREHMDNLAQRYARALVRFHITDLQSDFQIVCDLQNSLNEVCKEMAEEVLDSVSTL